MNHYPYGMPQIINGTQSLRSTLKLSEIKCGCTFYEPADHGDEMELSYCHVHESASELLRACKKAYKTFLKNHSGSEVSALIDLKSAIRRAKGKTN